MEVINLDPALPGTFPGLRVIELTFEDYQAGIISHAGMMIYFLPDEGVDNGTEIVEQIVIIYPNDDLERLKARIHKTEHTLLIAALREMIMERKSIIQMIPNALLFSVSNKLRTY